MDSETKASREPHVNDNSHGAEDAPGGLMADLVMGLRFYSRLYSGSSPHLAPNLSLIAYALPFTSLVIGALPALLLVLGGGVHLPSLFAATLAVLLQALITGAMAEDALGDAADGLAGGQTPERRLEILKDSRLGSYGMLAICFFVLLRVFALSALLDRSPLMAGFLLLAAGIMARSGSLWLTRALPPARRNGMSATAGRVSRQAFWVGLAMAVILGFVFAAPFVHVIGLVVSITIGILIIFGWSQLCGKLVGGQTGDLVGALQALLEIAALTVFIVVAAR